MRASPAEEGRRWLEQAREDLRWAEDLAQRGGYHIACFLAQQVGEKALKAFLFAAGEELVLGHSVERLCAEAGGRGAHLRERARRGCLFLNHFRSDPHTQRPAQCTPP